VIAQAILSILLVGVLVYASNERRRSPAVAWASVVAATSGLYFTWMPEHATRFAQLAGVGRGVDLVLYVWVCITLIVLLNLHLKLRTQMELVTVLVRTIALANVRTRPPHKLSAERSHVPEGNVGSPEAIAVAPPLSPLPAGPGPAI
jgi:small membrane protein